MQRLSLDFELATGTATMLGLYASYKWQMGFFFVFDLFSKISSAACSLIRVLLSVLPSLLGFLMQLCEQVNTREKPGTLAYFGLPCIPMIFVTLHGFTKAGWAHLKQTFFFSFYWREFPF